MVKSSDDAEKAKNTDMTQLKVACGEGHHYIPSFTELSFTIIVTIFQKLLGQQAFKQDVHDRWFMS